MRQPADRPAIDRFLATLGRQLRRPVRLYLVGGAIAVDLGLRDSTIDIDFAVDADEPAALDEFETLVRRLKDELQINAEPASPADFIPAPAGVLERARYVRTIGQLAIYHYDLATTIISKAARASERDLADAEALIRSGAIDWPEIDAVWKEIRVSPRGWLRHSPDAVARRLDWLRARTGE